MTNPPTCSVEGCASAVLARGWCTKHYTRWQRYGDPLVTKRTPPLEPDATEKVCPRCGESKLLRFYGLRKNGTRRGYCRECEANYDVEYRDGEGRKNKRAASLKWSRQSRDYRLRRAYGITEADYEAMAEVQNHRCAICGTDEVGGRVAFWHVDHCHTTGRVRGLLCHRCNMGLGYFKDDPDRLRAAVRYLQGDG